MNKIQKISKLFRIFFQIAFVIIPLVLVVKWIAAPLFLDVLGLKINLMPEFVSITEILSHSEKMFGFLIGCIPVGMKMLALYFLIKLFRLYENAKIFTSSNVRYIRNIGYTLLIAQLLNPVYEVLMSMAMTWRYGAGNRLLDVSFGSSDIGVMISAFLIILVSRIMAEGCKINEEQQLTV